MKDESSFQPPPAGWPSSNPFIFHEPSANPDIKILTKRPRP